MQEREKKKRKGWTHQRFSRLPLSPPEKCTLLLLSFFVVLACLSYPPRFIVTVEASRTVLSCGFVSSTAVVVSRSLDFSSDFYLSSSYLCSLSLLGVCLWGTPLIFAAFFQLASCRLRYHVPATQFSFYSTTGRKMCTICFQTCCRASFCSCLYVLQLHSANSNLVSAPSNLSFTVRVISRSPSPPGQFMYRPLFLYSPSMLDIDHQFSSG